MLIVFENNFNSVDEIAGMQTGTLKELFLN